jgi:hypothetical protein
VLGVTRARFEITDEQMFWEADPEQSSSTRTVDAPVNEQTHADLPDRSRPAFTEGQPLLDAGSNGMSAASFELGPSWANRTRVHRRSRLRPLVPAAAMVGVLAVLVGIAVLGSRGARARNHQRVGHVLADRSRAAGSRQAMVLTHSSFAGKTSARRSARRPEPLPRARGHRRSSLSTRRIKAASATPSAPAAPSSSSLSQDTRVPTAAPPPSAPAPEPSEAPTPSSRALVAPRPSSGSPEFGFER